MKLITLLFILSVFLLNSCSKANTQTFEVALPSIQCKSCVKRISTALKKVDGIEHFNINLKAKNASITFDSAKLKSSDVETEIAKVGYHANKTLRYASGYEKLDECCREPEEN